MMRRANAAIVVWLAGSLGWGAEFPRGAVVAVSAPGAEAGAQILKAGGNAVDAAVATALALAVTHPAAGNVGGGGFMLVHPATGEPALFDYREVAPAAATRDMFLHEKNPHQARIVGVPGTVRGLEAAHRKYGKLPWATLVQPAVRLASEGFVLDEHHAKSLNGVLATSKSFAEMQRVFAPPAGRTWHAGDRLVQPDLAKTMQRLADGGPDAFYTGATADLIVAEMKRGGGLITHADLKAYRAVERKPMRGTYRGFDVYAPPPPSSGGTGLLQMLGMLERTQFGKQGRFDAETLHLMGEAMRRAYLDRARHLGDPAFAKIPGHLLAQDYLGKLAESIDPGKATRSVDLAAGFPQIAEGESTTHFSVVDETGMAVSNTYTLEHSYGSRVVVAGAGFLLNNEMTDFNWKPGVTNRKGQIGTEANVVAPGKRMLSSQSPTILAKDGRVFLVTGSPGGRTIINTVLNVVVNVVDYKMPLQEAVDAPRLHHQWLPDEIRFEGVAAHAKAVERLRALGHVVAAHRQGDAHSIQILSDGRRSAAADKRLSGHAAGH